VITEWVTLSLPGREKACKTSQVLFPGWKFISISICNTMVLTPKLRSIEHLFQTMRCILKGSTSPVVSKWPVLSFCNAASSTRISNREPLRQNSELSKIQRKKGSKMLLRSLTTIYQLHLLHSTKCGITVEWLTKNRDGSWVWRWVLCYDRRSVGQSLLE
jgi:hypothetical protein